MRSNADPDSAELNDALADLYFRMPGTCATPNPPPADC